MKPMPKLSELIPPKENKDFVEISGIEIPIQFNMETLAYIADAYGDSFANLEKDLESIEGENIFDAKTVKIIKAFLYGMVRSGGTETTPDELMAAVSLGELPDVFSKVLEVFNSNHFQKKDAEQIKGAKGKN